jgi:structural maintenance of chromosome 4
VPPEAITEAADGGVRESVAGDVKPDPDAEEQPKKKAPARTPSYELHMYSAEELAGFKKREMIADAELLDGTSRCIFDRLNYTDSFTQRNSRMRNQI